MRGVAPRPLTRSRISDHFKTVQSVGATKDPCLAGQRDRQGNAPAHVIPLYADEITLELLRHLAPDPRYLKKGTLICKVGTCRCR